MGRHTVISAKNIVSIRLSASSGKDGPWTESVATKRSNGKKMSRDCQGAIGALAVIAFCLLNGSPASAQPAPAKQLMSEQAFKNVTVLKGIPVDEFMNTMGFISAATNYNCIDCHVAAKVDGDWSTYAQDTPRKQTA